MLFKKKKKQPWSFLKINIATLNSHQHHTSRVITFQTEDVYSPGFPADSLPRSFLFRCSYPYPVLLQNVMWNACVLYIRRLCMCSSVTWLQMPHSKVMDTKSVIRSVLTNFYFSERSIISCWRSALYNRTTVAGWYL